jgi:two-component system, LytTR family, response regulator
MKLTCIAIDDEPPALQLIKQYAGRMPQLALQQSFDDALEAKEFLQSNKIDLLFIAINMPGITGLDLVRNLYQKPLIIFTTAYKNFAYEGFELEAIDYLLKPISFDRFEKAVIKAAEYYQYKSGAQGDTRQHIFIRSEYRMIRIDTDDIIYIEGLEDYIKIHLQGERPLLTLMTMKAILEKLPANKFARIHRSYIIHTDKVKAVSGKKVVLHMGTELPVSDSYIDFIRKWIGEK